MAMVVWVMMGIAIWHFAVWLPDRFWGGIVGAFIVAAFGSAIFGFVVNGFTVPGRHDTGLVQAFEAIPGTLLALGLSWWYGDRHEKQRGPREAT